MIHVYHGDGKGKTTAAMGLALRMLAAGRHVVVVQFLKDGDSGEARLLAEHFGVPVFAGKVSDKFTWSMTSEELAATCELHDGNLASALAELEGAQEGLLVLDEALDALRAGATVLTDTNMALAGISKPALAKLGCKAVCYMADPDVAATARAASTTRAVASMDKACRIEGPLIVAVGNAPTALLRLAELMDAGKIAPALVVGVPVGFVNVVEAKEELLARRVPAIVARGRKGGSTVAAAIMNALLYQITRTGGPK